MHLLQSVKVSVLKICMQFWCTYCSRVIVDNHHQLRRSDRTDRINWQTLPALLWRVYCVWSSVQCETDCSYDKCSDILLEKLDFVCFFVNVCVKDVCFCTECITELCSAMTASFFMSLFECTLLLQVRPLPRRRDAKYNITNIATF